MLSAAPSFLEQGDFVGAHDHLVRGDDADLLIAVLVCRTWTDLIHFLNPSFHFFSKRVQAASAPSEERPYFLARSVLRFARSLQFDTVELGTPR